MVGFVTGADKCSVALQHGFHLGSVCWWLCWKLLQKVSFERFPLLKRSSPAGGGGTNTQNHEQEAAPATTYVCVRSLPGAVARGCTVDRVCVYGGIVCVRNVFLPVAGLVTWGEKAV